MDNDSVERLRLRLRSFEQEGKEGEKDIDNKRKVSVQIELPKPWSQSKDSFMPIVPVEKFFKDSSDLYIYL